MKLATALVALGAAVLVVPAAQAATTEDRTIGGDTSAAYSTLSYGPGWARQLRDPAAAARPGRLATRRSLLYFTQLSDFQLADEESPTRVEELDVDGSPATAAWRPQEAFGPFVIDDAIQQVNAYDTSPHAQGDGARATMDFSLTTGDSADNQQHNETSWVVTLLEGGRLDPNSGDESALPCAAGPITAGEAARYTGVQDYDDYPEGHTFYDPDQPAGLFAAWPNWPGLMDRAQRPFEATGLRKPSYVTFGNHDALAQGNAWANAGFEAVGTGCAKVFAPQTIPSMGANPLLSAPDRVVAVPADEDRRYVTEPEYRALHATGRQADAHGFGYIAAGEALASKGSASYYAWSPKPGFRFIALDTVSDGGIVGPSADGNIDDAQYRWVVAQLSAARTAGQLVVFFGHHPFRSLTSQVPDEVAPPCLPGALNMLHGHDANPGCDRDPRLSTPLHLGPEMQTLFGRHPNVIAYVAGHTHEHNIDSYRGPTGNVFWGIETSSESDWPIQSRLIEVMDNRDGTLSILGTLIDHASGPGTPAPGTGASAFSESGLASIGRELAFNDPQSGHAYGTGGTLDRNVELVLPDPRAVVALP